MDKDSHRPNELPDGAADMRSDRTPIKPSDVALGLFSWFHFAKLVRASHERLVERAENLPREVSASMPTVEKVDNHTVVINLAIFVVLVILVFGGIYYLLR